MDGIIPISTSYDAKKKSLVIQYSNGSMKGYIGKIAKKIYTKIIMSYGKENSIKNKQTQ